MAARDAMSDLLNCLRTEFGHGRFDALDVYTRRENPLLIAALDAEVPRLRYKHGGTINIRALRMALRRLPGLKKYYWKEKKYWQFYVEDPDKSSPSQGRVSSFSDHYDLPPWWYEKEDQ